MRYIDTNVFIRYLVGDNLTQAEAARALFHRLRDNTETVTTCEAIIAEIVYILRSPRLYGLSPSAIRDKLTPLFLLPGLILARRDDYLAALDLIVETPSLDFEDALCAAHMERLGLTEIYTFDRDFDRLSGIHRVEPGATDDR